MRFDPAVWPGAAGQVEEAMRLEYSRRLAIAVEAARNQGRFDFDQVRAQVLAELGLDDAEARRLFERPRPPGGSQVLELKPARRSGARRPR